MQIGTGLFYDRGAAQLGRLSARADVLNTQIAGGKKLTAPSQDVVAYNRLATIARTNADGAVYASNLTLAQSMLQQSDTTLSAVTTRIQRAQELTVQAANGTLDDDARKTIAIELSDIREDLVGLANTRDVRGQPLFGAGSGDTAVTQGADGSVSYTGSGTPATMPVADGIEIAATDSAERVFGPAGANVFSVLNDFIAALKAGGTVTVEAGSAIAGLATSLTQVTNAQGSIGARAARLDLVAAQASQASDLRELDRSGLEDTDLSATITELQKTMTVLQATQASFTKLAQLSLFDYLR